MSREFLGALIADSASWASAARGRDAEIKRQLQRLPLGISDA